MIAWMFDYMEVYCWLTGKQLKLFISKESLEISLRWIEYTHLVVKIST